MRFVQGTQGREFRKVSTNVNSVLQSSMPVVLVPSDILVPGAGVGVGVGVGSGVGVGVGAGGVTLAIGPEPLHAESASSPADTTTNIRNLTSFDIGSLLDLFFGPGKPRKLSSLQLDSQPLPLSGVRDRGGGG